MKFYKLNKFISIFLSVLIVLFVTLSCYTNVYADTQSSGNHFGSDVDLSICNKIYDGFDFSDTISKHESFYFSDNVGNKHAVARVGSAWICLFGTRATFNGSQDEQLNYYLSYYAYTGYKSISNSFGNLLSSKLGSITKGGYTLVENALSSNISNVASGISYNESDDSISFDSYSIDKLREEIKLQYYKSNGMFYVTKSGKPTDILKTSWYDDLNLYQEDFNLVSNYDYAIGGNEKAFYFNQSDFAYFYIYSNGPTLADYADLRLQFVNSDLKAIDLPSITGSLNCTDNIDTDDYTCDFSDFYFRLSRWFSSNYRGDRNELLLNDIISKGYTAPDSWGRPTFLTVFWKNNNLNGDSSYDYLDSSGFYSKGDKTLVGFISYEKLFDYVHGDSSSYLGSVINKTGEDISLSIKDMNENLGDKMDELIDSINSGKGNMTSDELQDAIDKGLEDLSKNTEDIKDNTSDILEVLKEQNQILLDILGVTKHIADTVDDIDDNANFSSLMTLLGTVFLGIQNAILYGQNTMDSDDSTDTQIITYDENGIAVYSSGGGTSLDYRGGIFGHFPFSVIYHLYDWLKVLQTEPKCPEFSYNYGFLIGRKDDTECQIIFDLSQYESWRDTISSFMKLSFTLAVAVGTYKKFKGGDLT